MPKANTRMPKAVDEKAENPTTVLGVCMWVDGDRCHQKPELEFSTAERHVCNMNNGNVQ